MPMPKQTRHNVDGCFIVVAWSTMRKIDEARGTPKVRGRLVTRMKIVPRFFSAYAFADSEAEVDEAGYSPPVPKPVMPRAMVNIQNMPEIVTPCAADASMRPRMIMPVVRMMATLRPM